MYDISAKKYRNKKTYIYANHTSKRNFYYLSKICEKSSYPKVYKDALVQKSKTPKKCAKVFHYKFTVPSFLVQQIWH